jgi:hypothetical protein
VLHLVKTDSKSATHMPSGAPHLGAPHLHSALSTEELHRRPSRPPDYATENRALIALTRELATSPASILQKLAETALSLCRAHSAGLSLLEESDQKRNFHWRAIAGEWASHVDGGTPRDFGPCGTVRSEMRSRSNSASEAKMPKTSLPAGVVVSIAAP